MKKLRTLLLVIALCAACLCASASGGRAAYSSTQAFIDVLESSGQPYELLGVDEYGAECLTLGNPGEPFAYTVMVMFEENLENASLRVWYVIEYDAAHLLEVVQVCNALNSQSSPACFYADESDNTVTVSMDLIFRGSDAGVITAQAVRRLTDALHSAYPQLLACTLSAQAPAGAPAAAPTLQPTAAPSAATVPPPAPSNEDAGSTVVVTAATARLRSAPSAAGSYVATVYEGERLPCLGTVNGWYAVDHHGRRAYISIDKAGLE